VATAGDDRARARRALEALAREREADGRHEEAALAWEQLAAGLTGRARAQALARQARLLAGALDQPDEAMSLYRRALANDASNPEILDALAELAAMHGDWPLLANLQRVLFEVTEAPERKAQLALAAGRIQLERLENPSTAKTWLEAGLRLEPQSTPHYEVLAEVERARGDEGALLRCLERLIELSGPDAAPAALLEAAALRAERGDHAHALAYLEVASARSPNDTLVLDALAEELSALERHTDLADVLERRAALAADDPPTRAAALVDLGELFEGRLFDPEAALDAFERAHAVDPAATGAEAGLTRLRAKLEAAGAVPASSAEPPPPAPPQVEFPSDPEDALRAFEREAQVTGDRDRLGFVVREIERLHARRGTQDEALPWVQRWVVAAPEDADALRSLARIHERAGREAQLCATLQALDPLLDLAGQRENRRRLGVLYLALDRLEDAARAFESALWIDPDDVACLEGLVEAHERQGSTDGVVRARTRLADQLAPRPRAECLGVVARLQEESGDLAGAIATGMRLERDEGADHDNAERLDALLERAGLNEEPELRLRERASALDSGSAEAVALELRRAALLLDGLRSPRNAVDVYRGVLAHAPESPEAREGLERALRADIDAEGLAEFLAERAASTSDPELRDRSEFERAVLLEEILERPAEARETYHRICMTAADEALQDDASRRYEALLERDGEWRTLRAHLESVLARGAAPNLVRLHERLARLCGERLHDSARELFHLEEIVRLDAARGDVWRILGDRYERDGRIGDRMRAMEAELGAGAENERALTLHARLAELCIAEQDDAARACEHYERLFALNPSHTAAAAFLVARYEAQERPEDVIRVLEARLAALETAPGEVGSDATGARTTLRMQIAAVRESQLDDLEGAISALEVALGEAGPASGVAEPLAAYYQRAGYSLDLIELCRSAAAGCSEPSERANWLVRLGDAYLGRDRSRDAADAYRQALTQRPDDRGVAASLRELYRQHDDAEPLARLLEAELTHLAGPDEIPVRLELAELLSSRLGRPEPALIHARRVLQLEPLHPAAFECALHVTAQQQQLDVALELLDARIEATRNSAERSRLYAERGRRLARVAGRRPEAVEALSQALELAPGSRELRAELAELLEACECWPELLECLEQEAREASRWERAPILERGATIAWDRISPDAALPWLERLRRERPDDERTTDRIVEAHRRASRSEALLRALADAEEISPDADRRRDLALERAALLEEELGEPGRALAVLRAARESAPRDVRLLQCIAQLQERMGHDAERAVTLEALLGCEGVDPTQIHRELGSLHAGRLADPDRAARHWTTALGRVPAGSTTRIEILRSLSELHRKAGRGELWARSAEEELAALDETPVFDDRRRELRRALAMTYDAELSRPGAALRHLRAVLDAGDEELLGAEVRTQLERTCLRLLRDVDDTVELEERLARHLERNAQDPALWLELARLREERLQKTAGAMDAYRRSLENDPTCRPALRGVRRTAERLGRWADVANALEREIDHPDCTSAEERSALLRRLGDVSWHRLESTTRASRSYAAALEANERDFASLHALQRLLESMEDWRGAIDLYESEIEMRGDDDPRRRREVWLRVAALAGDRTGEVERARRAFGRAAELTPLETPQLSRLAELHHQAQDALSFATTFGAWCDADDSDAAALDHVRLAECLEQQGRSDEALSRSERALQIDPGCARAWEVAGRLHEAAGKPTAAAEALERAAALLPQRSGTDLLLRAAALVEPVDHDRALDLLRGATERDPASLRGYTERARLASLCGLAEEAETAAARALDLDTAQALDPDAAAAVARVGGDAARSRGRLEAAAGFYARALSARPDDPAASSAYGETLAALGDHEAARDVLEARLSQGHDPDRARHRALLGTCYEALGRWEEALPCFESALEDDPGLEEALAGAVRVHESQHDVAAGVAALERWAATAATPRDRAERLFRAALCELRAEDLETSAVQHLRDAVRADPSLTRGWILLVERLCDYGRLEEAVVSADRAAPHVEDDADLGALALLQGRAYERLGAHLEAADSLGVAAEADPRCCEAALARARLLRAAGDWQDAADALHEFAERHPGGDDAMLSEIHGQLGRLRAGPLEDLQRAVASYRRALALDADRVAPRAALAALLSHDPASWEEALEHQRAVLAADPTDASAIRVTLRVARSRGNDAAVAAGLHILCALGAAAPHEREEAPAAPVPLVPFEPTLEDTRFEKLRLVVRDAAREIAEALGAPSRPHPPDADDTLAHFRAAALDARGRVTAPALLTLSPRELADIFELIATLVLDPDQVRGDGRLVNAFAGALGRRQRRRLRRILDGESVESLRAVDVERWRHEVKALGAAVALHESAGDLRTALLALVRDAREAADTDLPATADLGPLVATTPVARLLLRRIVLDWVQSIAQSAT
jgi:tetratricopeptide (TPR) repeat protein